MSGAEPNGKAKIGMWSGIVVAGISIITALLSTSYWTFTQLGALQLRINAQEQSLNEVETQFCAQDIVRNLMHANDLRNLSVLWEKQFGTSYPISNAYYPTICNRKPKQ